MAPIFHLSIPVSDLDASRAFYEEVLNARVGRVTDRWLDIWLFGVQLTLQQTPPDVTIPETGHRFHLGGTLSWDEWLSARDKLDVTGAAFVGEPVIDDHKGQAKLYLHDPDGYLIELKAYRDVKESLQRPL